MSARAGLASPGAMLRSARESRGLSIEEAADRLRLNEALVLAMEEDRFGLLGAPVFARGHLRNYAALVGAAEADILAAFDVGDVPEPTFLPALDRTPVRHRRSRAGWVAAAIALAAAIAVASYFAMRGPP
jgi:cytoskeleton protein RodZ